MKRTEREAARKAQQAAVAAIRAERLAQGLCRHCGGPVPCWSEFGDVKVGISKHAGEGGQEAMKTTQNGYDGRWIAAINAALADRKVGVRITDLTDDLWDRFIGPMLDAIEDEAKEAKP